jgi:hypothetical protein
MRNRVLPAVMVFAAACGDVGPSTDRFEGLWRLTSVNNQPIPVAGNVAGAVWAAAVLQVTGQTGLFDRCIEDPSTSTRISQSTPIIVAAIGDDRVTLSYFDRRQSPPDTARIDGARVALRYRIGTAGFDVLTFVPLAGELRSL